MNLDSSRESERSFECDCSYDGRRGMIESIVLKLCIANTHGKAKLLGRPVHSLRL